MKTKNVGIPKTRRTSKLKRFISVLLCFAMIISVVTIMPFSVFANEVGGATPTEKVIYDMQGDQNLTKLKNNGEITFLRGVGSSSVSLAVNANTNPKTVTVTNRGGTSHGIQVKASDINRVAKINCSYEIKYTGYFTNNPTAVARIRRENPTGETLATADAIDGEFTVSTVISSEQIAVDANSNRRYSLGNTSGNIDIVYTGITITEVYPVNSDIETTIYDMQNDANLPLFAGESSNISSTHPLLKNHTSHRFIDINSSPKTITITNRGGTSQGIDIWLESLNVRENCTYMFEVTGKVITGNGPHNMFIRAVSGNTSAGTNVGDPFVMSSNGTNEEFTLSLTKTYNEIINDISNDVNRYRIGGASKQELVINGIRIVEIRSSQMVSDAQLKFSLNPDSTLDENGDLLPSVIDLFGELNQDEPEVISMQFMDTPDKDFNTQGWTNSIRYNSQEDIETGVVYESYNIIYEKKIPLQSVDNSTIQAVIASANAQGFGEWEKTIVRDYDSSFLKLTYTAETDDVFDEGLPKTEYSRNLLKTFLPDADLYGEDLTDAFDDVIKYGPVTPRKYEFDNIQLSLDGDFAIEVVPVWHSEGIQYVVEATLELESEMQLEYVSQQYNYIYSELTSEDILLLEDSSVMSVVFESFENIESLPGVEVKFLLDPDEVIDENGELKDAISKLFVKGDATNQTIANLVKNNQMRRGREINMQFMDTLDRDYDNEGFINRIRHKSWKPNEGYQVTFKKRIGISGDINEESIQDAMDEAELQGFNNWEQENISIDWNHDGSATLSLIGEYLTNKSEDSALLLMNDDYYNNILDEALDSNPKYGDVYGSIELENEYGDTNLREELNNVVAYGPVKFTRYEFDIFDYKKKDYFFRIEVMPILAKNGRDTEYIVEASFELEFDSSLKLSYEEELEIISQKRDIILEILENNEILLEDGGSSKTKTVLNRYDPSNFVTIKDVRYSKGLISLDLSGKNITSADLAQLNQITNLTELNLSDNNIDSLLSLQQLSNLQILDLSNNNITNLSPLCQLTNLRQLNISENPIFPEEVENLQEELPDCEITHNLSDYIYLRNMRISKGETELDLSRMNLTNSELEIIGEMTNLEYLWLDYNYFDDISPLSNLTNLKLLSLEWCSQVSDLSPLSGLTNLEYLYLEENLITNDAEIANKLGISSLGVSPLSSLTNLKYLKIICTNISDFSSLSSINGLLELDLSHNQITSVYHLYSFTNLERLNLSGNPLTQTQVDGLKNVLADCIIIF